EGAELTGLPTSPRLAGLVVVGGMVRPRSTRCRPSPSLSPRDPVPRSRPQRYVPDLDEGSLLRSLRGPPYLLTRVPSAGAPRDGSLTHRNEAWRDETAVGQTSKPHASVRKYTASAHRRRVSAGSHRRVNTLSARQLWDIFGTHSGAR